jgi:hypothetical protein
MGDQEVVSGRLFYGVWDSVWRVEGRFPIGKIQAVSETSEIAIATRTSTCTNEKWLANCPQKAEPIAILAAKTIK